MQSLADKFTDQLHWLFLLLAGGFGLTLVFMTPPNGGSDEIAHEVKIVRVASGNLFGADPSIRLPNILRWHGAFSNVAMVDGRRRFSKVELKTALNAVLDCKPSTETANDNVAAYGPLPYVPQALIYRIGCATQMRYGTYLRTARLANLFVALALIGVGIAFAGHAKWVLFSVGLLPDTMSQLIAVSADAMLFGLSFALVGCVSAVVSGRLALRRVLIPLLALSVALSCGKPGYFWVPWIALATVPFSSRAFWPRVGLGLLFVLLPVVVQAGLIGSSYGSAPVAPGVNSAEQIRLLLSDPLHFVTQLVNVPAMSPIGTQWSLFDTLVGLPVWMDTRLPLWLAAALYGVLLLSMGMEAGTTIEVRARLLFAATACASVVLVALPLYAFATPTHEASISGLQGRYFIPSLLIFLAAGCLRTPGWARIMGVVVLVGLPCVALANTLALIRWRYFGD